MKKSNVFGAKMRIITISSGSVYDVLSFHYDYLTIKKTFKKPIIPCLMMAYSKNTYLCIEII